MAFFFFHIFIPGVAITLAQCQGNCLLLRREASLPSLDSEPTPWCFLLAVSDPCAFFVHFCCLDALFYIYLIKSRKKEKEKWKVSQWGWSQKILTYIVSWRIQCFAKLTESQWFQAKKKKKKWNLLPASLLCVAPLLNSPFPSLPRILWELGKGHLKGFSWRSCPQNIS